MLVVTCLHNMAQLSEKRYHIHYFYVYLYREPKNE